MNECDNLVTRRSAVLYEFLYQSSRLLVGERDERKMAYIFDVPKRQVENLERQVKNGLALPLAEDFYYQIEIGAKRRVYNGVRTRRTVDSKLAQIRAKYRGEESLIMSEDRIEREASRELSDLSSAAAEHLSAM